MSQDELSRNEQQPDVSQLLADLDQRLAVLEGKDGVATQRFERLEQQVTRLTDNMVANMDRVVTLLSQSQGQVQPEQVAATEQPVEQSVAVRPQAQPIPASAAHDVDSLELVDVRVNAELTKVWLEQAKLEVEKLRLEKQKLQQDIQQQQLHAQLESAKLQAEVKLKQQQAYEKERENSIWLQSEDDDEVSRRGWEDYEKRARAIRRAHGFNF